MSPKSVPLNSKPIDPDLVSRTRFCEALIHKDGSASRAKPCGPVGAHGVRLPAEPSNLMDLPLIQFLSLILDHLVRDICGNLFFETKIKYVYDFMKRLWRHIASICE